MRWTANGHRELTGVMETFLNWDVAIITLFYKSTKKNQFARMPAFSHNVTNTLKKLGC